MLKDHHHLLDEIDCKIVLVQESLPIRLNHLLEGQTIATINVPGLDFAFQPSKVPKYTYCKTFDEVRYMPLVILQTSGSTGTPHVIKVNHGILASMDATQLINPLSDKACVGNSLAGSRMLMAFPLYHMASFTLLLGLAVYYGVIPVLPPVQEPMTARMVDMIHASTTVDGSSLPPSLLIDMYDQLDIRSRLARLKYLFVAGGPLARQVGDEVSRYTHLQTLVGLTETSFPPHEILGTENWEYVRYSPFFGSDFRLYYEDLFEHFIIRRKELDLFQSIFSTYPQIAEFSTRDLYRKHPEKSNLWKHCGRTDDLIIFSNAEVYSPIDLESAVSSYPAVRSALVGGNGKFQTYLLVEPITVPKDDDEKARLINDVWPTIIQANGSCPSHARVMKDFVIISDHRGLQRAGKGTVQRIPTLEMYETDIDALYRAPEVPNISPKMMINIKEVDGETIHSALTAIVSSCAWLNGNFTSKTDLFSIGLDSLQTISLVKQINAYLIQLGTAPKLVNT